MRLREEFRGIRQIGESILEHLVVIRHGVFNVMSKLDDFNVAFTRYTDGVSQKVSDLQSKIDALTATAANVGNPDLDAAIAEVNAAASGLSVHVDTAPTPPTGDSGGATGGAAAGSGAGAGTATAQPGTAAAGADAGTGGQAQADTAGNRIGG